jgi:protein required for attachment to host cells
MRSWILIADAARARVFSEAEGEEGLTLVRELDHPKGRTHVVDLVDDEPGRLQKGKGGTRSAMDPRTSRHVIEVERFARELAGVLRVGCDARQYDALAIVAPPRFLGMLRAGLAPEVLKRLCATAAQESTHATITELPELLAGWLPRGWQFRVVTPS